MGDYYGGSKGYAGSLDYSSCGPRGIKSGLLSGSIPPFPTSSL